MFSKRLLMVISIRSPSPFCIDENRGHSTGRLRRGATTEWGASQAGSQAHVPASAATPLSAPMHDVERIRGLKFEHDIKHVSIGRDELPARIQAQMRKSMPYSFDDYMLVLRSLQLVDGKNDKLMSQLLDLYQ